MALLTPVDHNPFEDSPQPMPPPAAPGLGRSRLTPVQGNPFAAKPSPNKPRQPSGAGEVAYDPFLDEGEPDPADEARQSVAPPARHRTPLEPGRETAFQAWYRDYSGQTGLNPNPDDIRHAYDYRGWWEAMQADPERFSPKVDPQDGRLHGPSIFKDDDHPNRYVKTPEGTLDSKTGKLVETTAAGHVAELFKGPAKGAVQFGGTLLSGAAAKLRGSERAQLEILDRLDRGEALADRDDPLNLRRLTQRQRADLRAGIETSVQVPLTETATYRAGQAVSEYGAEILPAAPGYEESPLRQMGEGVGTLVAGAVASAIPGAGLLAFTLAGSGEAVERAVRDGATEDQIIRAADLGAIPGLTDSLPVETLLGRIPVPGGKIIKVSSKALGTALNAVRRIGWQAFIEGVQEGGQEFLQNLIAREVYKPDQDLTEGLPGSAGIGAGVGGIAQVVKEAVTLPFGRRRGGGAAQPPAPAQPGAEAPPAPPAPGATPAPEPPPPSGREELRQILEDERPIDEIAKERDQQEAAAAATSDRILGQFNMPAPGTDVSLTVPVGEGLLGTGFTQARLMGAVERDGQPFIRVDVNGDVFLVRPDEVIAPAPGPAEPVVAGATPPPVPTFAGPAAVPSSRPGSVTWDPAEGIFSVDPDVIGIDAAVMQFKESTETGDTGALEGIKKWDRRAAGVLLLFEDANGRLWVADGHQRTLLAKRLKSEGQDVRVNAEILRAADGFTAADARAFAALKNIQEGSGTAVDIAKALRVNPGFLENVPLNKGQNRDGVALSRLGDDASDMVVNDVVPPNHAAHVGRAGLTPEQQVAALGLLAKAEPGNTNEARLLVDQIKAAGFTEAEQTDMFGTVQAADSLMPARAKILDFAKKSLRADRATFKRLVDREADISEAGNVLATEANIARMSDDERLFAAIERLANRKGEISDALSEAARNFNNGAPIRQATRQFIAAIKNLERQATGRQGEGASDEGRGVPQPPAAVEPTPTPVVAPAPPPPQIPTEPKPARRVTPQAPPLAGMTPLGVQPAAPTRAERLERKAAEAAPAPEPEPTPIAPAGDEALLEIPSFLKRDAGETAPVPPAAAATETARPQRIDFTADLSIRNVDQLSGGTGARYLLAVRGEGDALIAKQWKRRPPRNLASNEVLVDFEPGKPVADIAPIKKAQFNDAKDSIYVAADDRGIELTENQIEALARRHVDEKISIKKLLDGISPKLSAEEAPALLPEAVPLSTREARLERKRREKEADARRLMEVKQRESKIRKGGQESVRDQEGGLFGAERDQGKLFPEPKLSIQEDLDAAHGKQVLAYLRAELDRLGLSDVEVTTTALDSGRALFKDLQRAGSKADFMAGSFEVDGLVRKIYVNPKVPSPPRTLRHEVIHALRSMGVIAENEWKILERAAKDSWRAKYNIDARYPNTSAGLRNEEAVADAFGDYVAGTFKPKGRIQRIFEKIRQFLIALTNALRANGFQTPETIFGKIQSGEIGRRAQEAEPTDPRLAAAYHGGPHDFDRFDIGKVGTGEGAQAYGWGLYFAGKKEVAEFYRDTLSRQRKIPEEILGILRKVDNLGFDAAAQAITAIRQNRADWTSRWEVTDLTKQEIDALEYYSRGPAGRLYKVNLTPAEDEYLYWDRPLSEQSEKVRRAVQSLQLDLPSESEITGSYVYDLLVGPNINHDNQKKASLEMLHAGIPGIKYLDQVSRYDTTNANALESQIRGDRAAVELLKNGVDKTRDPARGRANIVERERKIAELERQLADVRAGKHLTYNYVIFDDRHVEIEAKLSFINKEDAEAEARELEEDTGFAHYVHKQESGYVVGTNTTPVEVAGGVLTERQATARREFERAAGREPKIPVSQQAEETVAARPEPDRPAAAPGWLNKEIVEQDRLRHAADRAGQEKKQPSQLVLLSAEERQPGEQFNGPSNQRRQGAMMDQLKKGQPIDRAFRIPFDLFGGVDAKGQWKPGLLLTKKAGSIIANAHFSEAGRFSWLNGPLHAARAGLIDRYGLSKEYITRERQIGLDKRRIMVKGVEILKTLKEQNIGLAEAKVLQAILTDEQIPDAQWQQISAPIRQAIDDLGRAAVEVGLISRESYERNKGSYLHRVYMKHEADMNPLGSWLSKRVTSRRKKIIGDEMKGKGIFIEMKSDRLMKDVPGFIEAERGGPVKGEKYRLLQFVEETGDLPGAVEARQAGETEPRPLRKVWWPADDEIPKRLSNFRDGGVFEVLEAGKNTITLWRDYTKAERTRMGEILDARYTIAKTFSLLAHDLAVGKFYKDISENEDWASTQAPAGRWMDASEYKPRRWAERGIEWIKVPDAAIPQTGGKKRWGALAGKWVRAEIWRDLNEMAVLQNQNVWQTLLTQWKLNKTARSPVVHMNNIVSNLLFMDMADIRIQDLTRGLHAFVKETADYKDALDHGAFGSDMISQEVRREHLEPLLKEIQLAMQGGQEQLEARFGMLGKIAEAIWGNVRLKERTLLGNLDAKMLELYRLEDEVFRMATYMRRKELGDTAAEAADFSRQQFLDYDIRAPWVNMARRSVLPFAGYIYRAISVLARSIALHPWKYAKYMMIGYAVIQLSYLLTDDDDDEIGSEERRALREQQQGTTWIQTPRMLRMPWLDRDGNPVFLDIRRWIPAGDIFDVTQGSAALGLIPAPLYFGGPVLLAFEFLLNKSAFTGKDLVNERADDIWDKASKLGDWAWKSWMPSAAWIPGSWYWAKIGRSWEVPDALKPAWEAAGLNPNRGRDYNGVLYGFTDAVASSFGIKLQPHDVMAGFENWGREFDRSERELKSQARRAQTDFERGLISAPERDAQMAKNMRKVQRLELRRIETFMGPKARSLTEKFMAGSITQGDFNAQMKPIIEQSAASARRRADRAKAAQEKKKGE